MSQMTKDFALVNYEKSLAIAKKLNLYASHASLLTNVLDSVSTPFGLSGSALQKNFLSSTMSTGLKVLNRVTNTRKCADFLNKDESHSIRLLFPSLDFGYSYDSKSRGDLYDYFDTGANALIMDERALARGQLVPHIRLQPNPSQAKSLRQLLTKKCFQLGQTLSFKVRVVDHEKSLLRIESLGGGEADDQLLDTFEVTVLEDMRKLTGIDEIHIRGDGHITEVFPA